MPDHQSGKAARKTKQVERIKQPHEVLYPAGRTINWTRPPKPTAMTRWSKLDSSDRIVRGSLRTIAHLNRLNNLALDRFDTELVVIQPPFNTTVPASAGTHDRDCCVDLYIPGVDWWLQQRFFRANGLGCWYRHAPLFGPHIHGFTLPPREGTLTSDDFKVAGFKVGFFVDGGFSTSGRMTTSSQIADYYNHAFGLADQHEPGSDHSWFPPDIAATIFDLDAYVATRAALAPTGQGHGHGPGHAAGRGH